MFDLSPAKLLILAVIALVIFGPNELPRIARQAGRALRDLRKIAEGATADLREGLGPEFQDLDLEDLNPRRFVQKHLLDDPETASSREEEPAPQVATPKDTTATSVAATAGTGGEAATGIPATASATTASAEAAAVTSTVTVEDYRPPFDMDAT